MVAAANKSWQANVKKLAYQFRSVLSHFVS